MRRSRPRCRSNRGRRSMPTSSAAARDLAAPAEEGIPPTCARSRAASLARWSRGWSWRAAGAVKAKRKKGPSPGWAATPATPKARQASLRIPRGRAAAAVARRSKAVPAGPPAVARSGRKGKLGQGGNGGAGAPAGNAGGGGGGYYGGGGGGAGDFSGAGGGGGSSFVEAGAQEPSFELNTAEATAGITITYAGGTQTVPLAKADRRSRSSFRSVPHI